VQRHVIDVIDSDVRFLDVAEPERGIDLRISPVSITSQISGWPPI
jgi:hypothetical protein